MFEEIWELLRTMLVSAREHHRQYFPSCDRLSDCLLCQSDSKCLRRSTGKDKNIAVNHTKSFIFLFFFKYGNLFSSFLFFIEKTSHTKQVFFQLWPKNQIKKIRGNWYNGYIIMTKRIYKSYIDRMI